MKKFLTLLALVASVTVNAATWQDSTGATIAGNYWFTISGTPIATDATVNWTNYQYAVVGAGGGTPVVDSVWIKPDQTGTQLKFWIPTNTWLIASNADAGTTNLWITTTNSGMATNDFFILSSPEGGVSQLLFLGGHTTASGLVSTNASGYNQIRFWQAPSNAVYAGDKLYKMACIASLTPLTMGNVTNDVPAPWGNWWEVATRRGPLQVAGKAGYPLLVTMTYSNAAGLLVNGFFGRRP